MDKSGMTGDDGSHYLASQANDKADKLEWQMKVLAAALGIDDLEGEAIKLRDEEARRGQEKRAAQVAAAKAEAEAQGISYGDYMVNKIAERSVRSMGAGFHHLVDMMSRPDKEST